jgi:hypothetical protein
MSQENSEDLRAQAAQLRSMATGNEPPELIRSLNEMADRYDRRASALEKKATEERPAPSARRLSIRSA